MEMESPVFCSRQLQREPQHVFHLLIVDAEFVLRKSRGDVGMGVRTDVGIDSQAHRRLLPGLQGKLVYDLELGGGLHIES